MERKIYLGALFLFFSLSLCYSQVVTWGPASPAVYTDNINTCYDQGKLIVEFTNSAAALTDAKVEIQLGTGVTYETGSLVVANGPATIVEGNLSNLNRPVFNIGALASGELVNISISRLASCEAMDAKIGGGTFQDTVRVYEAGSEVTYSNGSANGMSNYDIVYASLSITGISTSPTTNNLGSTSTRSMSITNGSFGSIDEFYFADVFNAGDLDVDGFVINPSGANYLIPSGNISIVGDSVIIHFTAAELAAVDGVGSGTGDGDGLFEKDEEFVLAYNVSPNNCGNSNTIASELFTWWGCAYNDRCQIASSASSIGLNNAAPALTVVASSAPKLDFCDTVIYSVTLENTSAETTPAGGSFASDVTAILGFRANNTPISTLNNIRMWGSERYDSKFFINHKLNGIAVTLPTIAGVEGLVPYLPPNHFSSDPDGPGGLDDLDGDGFFDDLARGDSLTISYGAYMIPLDPTCGLGRADYTRWEHISADISWHNQCGTLMSPIRQQFNYTNTIKDYNNSTFVDFPTDIEDADNISVGIMPHLHSTMYCDGASALTSASMDWITTIVLPAGLSMESGYDPLIYDVSNDTVIVTGKYAYDWTNFPLTFSCDNWDGANPIVLPFKTTYLCKNGTDTCFIKEMHCYDANIVPHCPAPCTGVTPLSFSTNRISESWTDNTKTALVDLNDPDIVKDFVYPYDTVSFNTVGVMSDTVTDNLYLRFEYTTENGGNIFDYIGGEITIVDVDGEYNSGTTNYTFPLTGAPTITNLPNSTYEVVFDLSSYRNLIDANYEYGQGNGGAPAYDADTIMFDAQFIIKNTMTVSSKWQVNNFRSRFFLYDANTDEVSCNSWGSQLSYERVKISASDFQSTTEGCNSVFQYFYLTHNAQTDDDHPNEYRPVSQIDSAIVSIPLGFDVGEVKWYNASTLAASDYELRADRTLLIKRPPSFKDFDKANTFSPRIQVELLPNCLAQTGLSGLNYTAYFKEYTYLTDTTKHIAATSSDNAGTVYYQPPTMTITPLNQSVPSYRDTVAWTVSICNSTSDMDINYNWVLLESGSGQILIDSVLDVTGGVDTMLVMSTTPTGEKYVKVGALDNGECTDIEIFAHFTACDTDALSIVHGWSCSEYPATNEVQGCGAQNEVYVLPQNAQISTTITALADTPVDPSAPTGGDYGLSTIDMCTNFPAEILIVNAQPGFLYNVNVDLKIPTGGAALSYVPGSATIEVEGIDPVNVPRSIGAAAEAALVAASGSSTSTWTLSLADLDPTNFGNGEALAGTSNSTQNEFILRWEMQSNCELSSGDQFVAVVNGDAPCGGAAAGSGEQVNSFPLNIDGVAIPYYTYITNSVAPNTNFEGCNDSKTLQVEILITGGSTGTTDTLQVTLPEGMTYGAGYVCQTPGKCPVYIGSTIVSGLEVASFAYPSGESGTIEFDFDVATSGRGACGNNEVVALKSISTLVGVPCSGGPACGSTDVVTGLSSATVSFEKPVLDLALLSLKAPSGSSPYIYEYEIELMNAGLDTENDVIIEFYCLNGTGDDIIGSAVASDTLFGIFQSGTRDTLVGSFVATCDPTKGVVALIVPEYENCYCDAIESMADKVAGLDQFPYDKMTNVPLPVELADFRLTEEGCNINLQWETFSETNNHYFDLERSVDGVNFQVINRVLGKGTSVDRNTYYHLDPIKEKDKELYYRLKQVDYDGVFEYSPILSLRPSDCGSEVGDFLSVYPNPVEKGVEVNVVYENDSNDSKASVRVISMQGLVVKNFDLEGLDKGINNFSIDLTHLPGGNYIMELEKSDGRFSRVKLSVIKL